MKYSHIVFDIDGTLTDSEYAAIVSLQEMVKIYKGTDYAYDELKFALGITGADALSRMGFAPEEIAPAMRDWESGLRRRNDDITVFEGAEALLAALKKRGCALGIVTSKTRDQYNKDFCRFEIAKYFDFSITCEETDDPKPGAGPLKAYMKATGAKPEDMLYIGDSVYDSMCAGAADVDFALATWGTSDMAIEAKYRPDSLLELLEMMK